MKNILVAGGGGYIGSALCKDLLMKGYRTHCLDRFFFGKAVIKALMRHENFQMIRDDIRYVSPEIFSEIDVVIDLAGISNDPSCDLNPGLTEDINFKGNLRLARLAQQAGVKKYIFSSTCSIYGAGGSAYLSEEAQPHPVSLYAQTKLRAEEALLKLSSEHFCVTIVRNATVFGVSPRMRFDLLVNLMTAHAVTKRKIYVLGGGKQWRPIIHLQDLIRALGLLLDVSPEMINKQIFNLGTNNQNYQVIQVAHLICDIIPNVEIVVISNDEDKRNYRVDFSKIERVLGFKQEHTLDAGVQEIKSAIETAKIDVDDIRTVTLKYYKYLMESEAVLDELKLDGKLF